MSDPGAPPEGGQSPAASVPGLLGGPPGGGEPLAAGLPGPAAAPAREDVLGLRIAAALIDVVLLAALFAILALTVGNARTGSGTMVVSLSGTLVLSFLAVMLLYYFALEASLGQTVGKRLLGLRVFGPEGQHASVAAIAGRTVLRLVDWLPLLYLIGFIAVVGSGRARRQRIGDIAAGTSVARTQPVRNRWLSLLPLVVAIVLVIGLTVVRPSSAGSTTYRAHGVSFDYPAGWQVKSFSPPAGSAARQLWGTAIDPGVPPSLITVGAVALRRSVTAADLGSLVPEIDAAVQRLFQRAGGSIQQGPERIVMAGSPAVQYAGTGKFNGSAFQGTVVYAFDGTTEYYVRCVYPPQDPAGVRPPAASSWPASGQASRPATAGPFWPGQAEWRRLARTAP